MKKYYNTLLIISLFIFAACTEDYTKEIDKKFETEKIIIEATITSKDTIHSVKLSKIKPYFANTLPPTISGAKVSIERLSTGDIDILAEKPNMSGTYVTHKKSFIAGLNEKYKLIVSNTGVKGKNGKDYYEAICQLRPSIPIDSISVEKNSFFYIDQDISKEVNEIKLEIYDFKRYWKKGQDVYVLKFFGKDPKGIGDYYRWRFYKNGILETDTLNEMFFQNDELFDNNYLYGIETWSFGADNGDMITLETNTITKEFYEYMHDIMLETEWNAGPFGGPPANPKTNISNGALGFFAAYSVSKVYTRVHTTRSF